MSNLDLTQLSFKDLGDRYDNCADETELAALEDEIAARWGYASADEWYAALAKNASATKNHDVSYNEELTQQPYYLPSNNDEGLCDFCQHLNFQYMITHRLEARELCLGSLKDLVKRTHCAFCRLVVEGFRLALDLDALVEVEGLRALLHSVPKNGDTFSLFDLAVSLEPGTYPTMHFQKLANEDGHAAFEGRRMNGHEMDFVLVRSWLDDCLDHRSGHDGDRARTVFTDDGDFTPTYLLDVLDNCVVETEDKGYCYLALSYVWGGPQPVQLLQENKDQLMSKGSLAASAYKIPATIADSMELVRKLGERYLWIDALCIVQDDLASKEPELRAMDKVYDFAVLTIVAGHGASAYAGLPGTRHGTRAVHQHVEGVQGMKFANRLPTSKSSIDQSVWNTRAWTYQERILAKRKLFISASQVSFMCEHTEIELCEDVYSLPLRPSTGVWSEGEDRAEKWKVDYPSLDEAVPVGCVNTAVYATIVQRFTSRELSFHSDILNAFIGVSNRLTPLFRDGFRFGLPKNELDTELLWQPMGDIKRRIDPHTQRPIYPTWSWAGWVGPVTGNLGGRLSVSEFELMHDTKDAWFTMDRFRGVDHSSLHQKWERAEWRGYIFWHEKAGAHSFYAHPVEKPSFQKACRPRLLKNAYGSAEILIMRADVARLHVCGERNPHADWYMETKVARVAGIEALVISDDDGSWMGTVFVPSSIASEMQPAKYSCIKISTTSTDHNAYGLQPNELIVFEKCFDINRFERTPDRREQIDIVMIEERGGISYRLGAGVCHAQAFSEAGPIHEEIRLG